MHGVAKAVLLSSALGTLLGCHSEQPAKSSAVLAHPKIKITDPPRLCLTDRSPAILAAHNGLRYQGAARWHGGTS